MKIYNWFLAQETMMKVVIIILALIPILICVSVVRQGFAVAEMHKRGIEVNATVMNITSRIVTSNSSQKNQGSVTNTRTEYTAHVVYSDVSNVSHESSISMSYRDTYQVGDTVKLTYLRENPKHVLEASQLEQTPLKTILICALVLFVFFIFPVGVWYLMEKRSY